MAKKELLIKKIVRTLIETIPVVLMILFIPIIKNDYILSFIFLIIIAASLFIKYEKNELLIFIFGFFIMIIFEALFVKTGVEIFLRNTLFGIMPLWLPLLWAYGFIAIKRGVKILGF